MHSAYRHCMHVASKSMCCRSGNFHIVLKHSSSWVNIEVKLVYSSSQGSLSTMHEENSQNVITNLFAYQFITREMLHHPGVSLSKYVADKKQLKGLHVCI